MNKGIETQRWKPKLSVKNKTWASQEALTSSENQKKITLISKCRFTSLDLNTLESGTAPAGLGCGTSQLSVQNSALFHTSLSGLTFCKTKCHIENKLCSALKTKLLHQHHWNILSWQDLRFLLSFLNIHDLHSFVSLPMEKCNNLSQLH